MGREHAAMSENPLRFNAEFLNPTRSSGTEVISKENPKPSSGPIVESVKKVGDSAVHSIGRR